MDKRFSRRADAVSGSAIRDIFKLLEDPQIISFAGGMPAADSFPYERVQALAAQALAGEPAAMLQYGQTEGYRPLREQVAAMHQVDVDNVQIVTGAQQGIDLAAKAFLDPGDTIMVEAPTFLGALQIFQMYEANIVPVKTDENGLQTDDLLAKIEAYNPKMLYIIPTFQNPTGVTTTLSRRQEISKIAGDRNLMVLEDDPYGRLRFEGEALPTIYSLNQTGNVIHLMTFSKTIAPALRVGAVIADSKVRRKITVGKQSTDVHTPTLNQAIASRYLACGEYEGHITSVCAEYKERRDKMLSLMDEHFPGCVTYTRPKGGLFIWASLPEGTDSTQLFKQAVQKKVAFVPGSGFYSESGHNNCMRLNFSASSLTKIETGILALAQCMRESGLR